MVVLIFFICSKQLMALEDSCLNLENQGDLNACACKDFTKADAELNKIYQAILQEYKDSPIAIKRIKKAELSWIRFREDHMESLFPKDSLDMGSSTAMCTCSEYTKLIKQRIAQLKEILNPQPDMCEPRMTFEKE